MNRITTGRVGLFAFFAAAVFLAAGRASGQTVVGYWRMETDTDAGATTLSVPNQVAGGNPLISATASLALPVPGFNNAPTSGTTQIVDPLTVTTVPNTMALNGDVDVAATAASYAALNVSSVTVEGFFRTQEGTATLVARSAGTAGFVMSQPNNVTVTYFVNGVSQTLAGGTGGITGGAVDLDIPYTHLAFTYDSTSGVANLYANGVLRGTNTTAGGGALFGAADTSALNVGGGTFTGPNTGGYDGGAISSTSAIGIIDEVRITNAALTPAQFLQSVPEPTGAALLAGFAAIGLLRRRHPRAYR